MTYDKGKAIYTNLLRYWWLYGLAGAVLFVAVNIVVYGWELERTITTFGASFVIVGVMLRWNAKYQLSELEKSEKQDENNH